MRAWPILQIVAALVFLGVSVFSLAAIIGGRNGSSEVTLVTEDSSAENEQIDIRLSLSVTAPITITSLHWGEVEVTAAEPVEQSWSSKVVAEPDGPLKIAGTVLAESLPLALRVEAEVPGRPSLETVRWIKSTPFQITLYPAP